MKRPTAIEAMGRIVEDVVNIAALELLWPGQVRIFFALRGERKTVSRDEKRCMQSFAQTNGPSRRRHALESRTAVMPAPSVLSEIVCRVRYVKCSR